MSTNTETIRILIADDHQMIIDGIKGMLGNDTPYQITGEAINGQDAYDMIQQQPDKYDLLVTDVSMSHLSGIELCRMVKAQFPQIKVLVLSMYSSSTVIREALAAEADGYILKNTGRDEFLRALHRICDGGTYFTQDILPVIYQQFQKEKKQQDELAVLSTREKEVLALIIREYTSAEIADKLFISKKTVDNHRQNILTKTNCKTTIGLVKYAIRNGLE